MHKGQHRPRERAEGIGMDSKTEVAVETSESSVVSNGVMSGSSGLRAGPPTAAHQAGAFLAGVTRPGALKVADGVEDEQLWLLVVRRLIVSWRAGEGEHE